MNMENFKTYVSNNIWSMVISNFMFHSEKSHQEACHFLGNCYRERYINSK
ncbi:hypothetical protein VMF7928_01461 [Vibrio marisflavi CECT 7928]|uniref:Uncharacterized protein n=1 Tax=Vibrio marisflavi CECT 7928 TaxID=634439 RepID=A0ABM9A202_9VIBR|nr:hypothetical protein VMF7928_01461 [Vibrio marisflavi CECT 7928]